ncbi:hypothetical protein Cgig2_006901 [Carnegiea gigantea]|uniref:Uncharacterized protein n=1 Tax=Carnegiea gigantea TaxID=171969 RepID=A0A9Q1QC42_9CARY|nr:hypothetical protein Cgig2_006901 [Carnegiea gigantea]
MVVGEEMGEARCVAVGQRKVQREAGLEVGVFGDGGNLTMEVNRELQGGRGGMSDDGRQQQVECLKYDRGMVMAVEGDANVRMFLKGNEEYEYFYEGDSDGPKRRAQKASAAKSTMVHMMAYVGKHNATTLPSVCTNVEVYGSPPSLEYQPCYLCLRMPLC